jgi:pyruvate/2-oxoglutarate dehydrogenase complex dihydrolipoamide dehydrogenase (E3) component
LEGIEMPDFDVVAIGGGTAGLTVAIGGAALGLRIGLVERDRVGGECTWTGCVPSKALLHAGKIAAAAQQAAQWSSSRSTGPRLDFAKVKAFVHGARAEVVKHETPEYLEREYGISVLRGEAQVKGEGVLEVDGRRISTRHIVICTGSEPNIPFVPGLEETRFLTSETLFDDLGDLPERLAVIGGGTVGCEMAQAFARLGTRVTLIEAADRLLPEEDADVSPVLRQALERDGVTVHSGTQLTKVTPATDGSRWAMLSFLGKDSIEADAVLVATGKRPRTSRLGLVEIGIKLAKEGIVVDEYLRTSVPRVWAAGDVVGAQRLTNVAEMHGSIVLRNILFPWRKEKVDYRVVPRCVFTDPEIGHVGMTEAEARQRYGAGVHVTHVPMSRVDRAVAEGSTAGFLKLVTRRRHILGADIVGPSAGELTQQVALAMKHGLPVSALGMVAVYPAMAYGLHQAANRASLEWLKRTRVGEPALGIVRRLALRA